MDAKYSIPDSDISNTIVYNSVVHIVAINNAAILGQNKIWFFTSMSPMSTIQKSQCLILI